MIRGNGVGLLITGSDSVATQSALLGRHDEYNLDRVAVLLTAARGEDGLQMPRIIKANPADLLRLLAPGVAERIVTLRQVHRDYLPILLGMARHHVESARIFASTADEREAGHKAAVWTTYIRTQRTTPLSEDLIRRIVREEMRPRQPAE